MIREVWKTPTTIGVEFSAEVYEDLLRDLNGYSARMFKSNWYITHIGETEMDLPSLFVHYKKETNEDIQ